MVGPPSAAAAAHRALAVLALAPRLDPRPSRPAFEALGDSNVYKKYLAEWWAEHESWRAAFPPSSVLELQKLYAPKTPKVRGIPHPSEEQLTAHAEAAAVHAEAHGAWKPVSIEREKAVQKESRAVKRKEQACTRTRICVYDCHATCVPPCCHVHVHCTSVEAGTRMSMCFLRAVVSSRYRRPSMPRPAS